MIVLGESSKEELQTNVFWVGDIQEGVEMTLRKWGRYVKEQFPNSVTPETEYHCTMRIDPSRDNEIEKKWLEETQGQRIRLTSEAIIMGPAGAALTVETTEGIT